jgi:pyrroloquinoline quinone biosynthesis protein D
VIDEPASTSRPALKRGCRLSPASHPESLLFIPEGALRLHGPGRRILELCDGQRTMDDLIKQLQSEFPEPEAERISGEVISFLKRLQETGAIEFV